MINTFLSLDYHEKFFHIKYLYFTLTSQTSTSFPTLISRWTKSSSVAEPGALWGGLASGPLGLAGYLGCLGCLGAFSFLGYCSFFVSS